ncbi:MAG: asparagine synthase (glutamine-hydrolyzing) [Bacteroidales bacterium]|nr:asparagine synthase (glutamine-hydrolyzing) [Bacteroidales bacterium]
MCGIAGIYHFGHRGKPVDGGMLSGMLKNIRHRGPDESGIYLGDNIGLGSVRLSIIDLSTGQQPISINSGRYWIVYNGEVFNYPELRSDLEKSGCKFKTTTDTEVVVQSYAKYGKDCLQKFNGQFAFAIWDEQKKEIFLARDRMGIRPLFYTSFDGTFAFCSEIKGLFEIPEIKRSISTESLAQVFNFWTTITPNTPFENILELPPGHWMTVSENEIRVKKYWKLSFPTEGTENKANIKDAIEAFRDLFYDAVKIRLRADVEVAAYLSGGIDSSVTTAFIHEIEPGILNTFSIGFSDRDFDETHYQLEASRYFNTHHTAFTCTSEEIGEKFLDTVLHAEFPILRTAPTPMYLLSRMVREKNIKVVITGEGADEMLAGYNIFKEAKIRRFWARQPQSAIRPLLLTKLYPYLPMMKNSRTNVLKMFFGYRLGDTTDPFYSHLLRWHNTSRIINYLSSDVKSDIKHYNPLAELEKNIESEFSGYGDLAKAQYLEATVFMSGYLLSSQGDRVAMANSVEGRYPFLDHRVIEFSANLPEDFKLHGLNEKYLLKKMMLGKIPDSILKRYKQAYRAPIQTSFFGKRSPTFVEELLSQQSIQSSGYFDFDLVDKLANKFRKGETTSEVDNMALAAILSTQLLHNMFIRHAPGTYFKQELSNLVVFRKA